MDSTPTKRKRYDGPSTSDSHFDVEGYVHEVSPIKTSADKKRTYFNIKVQTSRDEFHNGVVFNADKRNQFSSICESKTPIKLKHVTRAISFTNPSSYDVKCNHQTTLEPLPKKPFPYSVPDEDCIKTLENVEKSAVEYQYVTVKAKVMDISKLSERNVRGGSTMEMVEVVLADNSKGMILSVWGEEIKNIRVSECYIFKHVGVRKFNGTSLTTSAKTIITWCENIGAVSEDYVSLPKLEVEVDREEEVTVAEATRLLPCQACKKAMPANILAEKITRCSYCSMKQKVQNIKPSISMVIQFATSNEQYKIYNTCLVDFLTKVNKKDLLSDPEDLEDFFLTEGPFKFQVAKTNVKGISFVETVNSK